jgi:hypothetical protein
MPRKIELKIEREFRSENEPEICSENAPENEPGI